MNSESSDANNFDFKVDKGYYSSSNDDDDDVDKEKSEEEDNMQDAFDI